VRQPVSFITLDTLTYQRCAVNDTEYASPSYFSASDFNPREFATLHSMAMRAPPHFATNQRGRDQSASDSSIDLCVKCRKKSRVPPAFFRTSFSKQRSRQISANHPLRFPPHHPLSLFKLEQRSHTDISGPLPLPLQYNPSSQCVSLLRDDLYSTPHVSLVLLTPRHPIIHYPNLLCNCS